RGQVGAGMVAPGGTGRAGQQRQELVADQVGARHGRLPGRDQSHRVGVQDPVAHAASPLLTMTLSASWHVDHDVTFMIGAPMARTAESGSQTVTRPSAASAQRSRCTSMPSATSDPVVMNRSARSVPAGPDEVAAGDTTVVGARVTRA